MISNRYALLKSTAIGLVTTIFIAACGGGGSAPAPNPTPPSNSAPQVSVSVAAATVQENSTPTVAEATATDADGDTVTLTLSGPDASAFAIDADGNVTFANAPDFETPTDTDGDNVYEASVTGSDGNGGSDVATFEVTVTDLVPLPTFTEVTDAFSFPTYAAELPGTNGKLLVLEKGGRARLLDPATGAVNAVDFHDFSATLNTAGEGGLLGFAVPDDFTTSQRIYFYVVGTTGAIEVRALDLATTETADPSSETTIISIPHPRDNHKGGWLGFDANGFLVVPTGDSGSSGDPDGVAQNPQSLLGKVLRLDVSTDAFPADPNRNYAIPAGNTFANAADGAPEIFAVGLRNPFRASFDPASGDLLIADVGQNEREEINRLPMDDSSLNFGWNAREGSLAYNMGADSPAFTLPIAEYEHGDGPTQGNSITGGTFFDGGSDALSDAYVFADFSSDNVWTIPADTALASTPLFGDSFTRVNDDLLLGSESPSGIVSLTADSQNRLFVTTIGGTIYQLEEQE